MPIALRLLAAVGFFAVVVPAAPAAYIWDYSPAAHPDAAITPGWTLRWWNQTGYQLLAGQVQFDRPVRVTGFDQYTRSFWYPVTTPFLGQEVSVWVWADADGFPGELLSQHAGRLIAVDDDGIGAGSATGVLRAGATLDSPFTLPGGVPYWIGLSGAGFDLGAVGLGGPGAPDGPLGAYFWPNRFVSLSANLGQPAFRLQGDVVHSPAPAGLLLAALGAPGLWLVRRQRRA